jgi:hypothetical protein
VNQPLEPGKIMNTELSRPSKFWCSEVPLRVIYALSHPNGEYVVGGAFTRQLTNEELLGLLSDTPI